MTEFPLDESGNETGNVTTVCNNCGSTYTTAENTNKAISAQIKSCLNCAKGIAIMKEEN